MKNIIHVIPKWEGGKVSGNAVLFLPEYSASAGRMVCYAHMGQHSEADLCYYWELRNPKGDYQQLEVKNLLTEYRGKLEQGEELRVVSRDREKFRKERYAHAR